MKYELIRSDRKSIAIQIRSGRVIVRAPVKMSDADIRKFVSSKQDWIEKHLAESAPSEAEKLSYDDVKALADRALAYIPPRVAYYAKLVGVSYGRICIRNQKSKWGSCSSKGNLNFNCLLMLMPPEVIDSVIVHELCHRKEMNHSPRFYAEVLRVMPDYYERHKWIKEHGEAIMRRMTG